jgi:protein-S-isoprenylcysteine O-methyltransferase Ste14
MPKLTLVLWLVYLSISIGARVIIQLRTTGSTGFVLHRSGSSRLQRLASALFVSSLLAGLASPVLALALPEQALWAPWQGTRAFAAVGGLLYTVGVALAFIAQLTLGRSWRIGVDAQERTEFIMRGAFRLVRNPVFSALQLTAVALAFLCSTPLAWIACAVQLLALELQVRGVEEPHLARVHAAAYLDYAAKVGRFIPGIGLRPKLRT